MLHSTLLLLGASFSNAWFLSQPCFHPRVHNCIAVRGTACSDGESFYNGEVVGSSGKIGSYILHSLNCKQITDPGLSYDQFQYQRALATPRGLSPGCLSRQGTPIYACIPSSSISDVWDATLPHRRKDLVFLCNCVPSRHLSFITDESDGITVAILHFGVSKTEQSVPTVNCSTNNSPPTNLWETCKCSCKTTSK
jgi:hypothetical protein